VLTILANGAE